MSSKRNGVIKFNDGKKGISLNKIVVLCFSVEKITMDNALCKTQIENVGVQGARAFLSKLHLTKQNVSHERFRYIFNVNKHI